MKSRHRKAMRAKRRGRDDMTRAYGSDTRTMELARTLDALRAERKEGG
ncbi:hypothetical protein ACFFUB_02580 [Algimonas porphyrae]|uniref:Uncharacterized protein n=1 Tax=Algimonas porphyrae TaxID=1128113 RepID=A0ABQ5V102_9PROT|nr:hypothetical protein [Algimonas porphyrae]GLQ20354.1 hypothetical protein GCM10007854_13090 [Algimonas porphyrae]